MTLSDMALAGFTSSVSRGFKVPSSNLLAPLGDLNNDGIDDFGVATAGVLTAIWGQNGGFSSDLDVMNILIPSQGIKILSPQISAQVRTNFNYVVGTSFAAADLNNDGLPDIVIVNAQQDAFIVWGSGSNMTSNMDLSVPSTSYTKFTSPVNCPFGNTLALIDFDKNGWTDIALSAPQAGATSKGSVYVMLNQLNAFSNTNITMSTLNAVSVPKMITIGNGQDNDQLGIVLANLDDVTDDGYSDLGIGLPLATKSGGLSTGKVIVIKGTSNPTDINLANLTPSQGSVLIGSQNSAKFGHSISPVGDFNGDGLKDFAVGSLQASPISTRADSGQVDIILGKSDGIPSIDFSSSTPMDQFIRFIGDYTDTQAGAALGLIVNPDGTPIMLIGCPNQQYVTANFAQIKVVIGANGTYPTTDLANLADPYGFSITGPSRGDHSGYAVGSLGYITNGTYPSYYVTSAIGAFVLNGFNVTSPVFAPSISSSTGSSSSSSSASLSSSSDSMSSSGGSTSSDSGSVSGTISLFDALDTLLVTGSAILISTMAYDY